MIYGKCQQLQFLEVEVVKCRNYSDETACIINTEIISANRNALEKPANLLQEKQVIYRQEMMALLESN